MAGHFGAEIGAQRQAVLAMPILTGLTMASRLPYTPLHARIWALHGAMARRAGHGPLRIWQARPYAPPTTFHRGHTISPIGECRRHGLMMGRRSSRDPQQIGRTVAGTLKACERTPVAWAELAHVHHGLAGLAILALV